MGHLIRCQAANLQHDVLGLLPTRRMAKWQVRQARCKVDHTVPANEASGLPAVDSCSG